MQSENQKLAFWEILAMLLNPSDVHQFQALYERIWKAGSRKGTSDGQGQTVESYFRDRVIAGIESRIRSIEHSEQVAMDAEQREAREKDAELFAKSVLQNPDILSDLPTLLAHAANYKVDVKDVLELFTKASASKAKQAKTAAA